MARYIGPVCKLCRREAVKLFLKGERCYTKCPLDKPNGAVAPGQHGTRRSKFTEYGKRLREKQKARRISGVLERQFYRYFREAEQAAGSTGESLLRLLEMRLDNVVRRLGFSTSLAGARQLVLHGHILLNGRRVTLPSQGTQPGDRVELSAKMKANAGAQRCLRAALKSGFPSWLELEETLVKTLGGPGTDLVDLSAISVAGKVKISPSRQEMSYPVNEQFIVELYSK